MEETKQENKQNAEQQSAKPATVEIKIDPYKVYGEDILLTDKNFIDFYKYRFVYLAFKNNLVGRFSSKGTYSISPQVKADLVRMPKEIEDMGSDFYKASNIYMKKYFFFDVKLVMLENNKAKASLYLTENMGIYYSDPHITTHIADFIDDYDEEYKIKLRQAFNLLDISVPVNDFLVPELAVIMQDNFDFMLINEELFDMVSKVYVLKMLELLEKSGVGGIEIIQRYKQLLSEAQSELDKAKFKNNVLKAILDRAIDEKGGIEKLPVPKEQTVPVIQEINKSIKTIVEPQKSAAGVETITTKPKDNPISSTSDKGSSEKKTAKAKPAAKGGGSPAKTKTAAKPSEPKKESSVPSYDASLEATPTPSDSNSGSGSSKSHFEIKFTPLEIEKEPPHASNNNGEKEKPEPKEEEVPAIDLDAEDTPDAVYGKDILDEEIGGDKIFVTQDMDQTILDENPIDFFEERE